MRTAIIFLLLAPATWGQNIGIITTIAGAGLPGYNGDNIPATRAMLDFSIGATFEDEIFYDYCHPAFDAAGNLYIPDKFNNRIRKISQDGVITTFAGNGQHSFGGNGGPAAEAALDFPTSVAFDPAGNMFFIDQHNNRVRKVDTSGIITTVAGSSNGFFEFSGNGGPATAAQLFLPGGLAFDRAGNYYISDTWNNQIRKVAPNGTITAFAGIGDFVEGHGFGGDGGPAARATLDFPAGLAFDPSGNLYFADQHNSRIRRVSTDGVITTVVGNGTAGFSGDGGPATDASLDYPTDVAFDAAGNLYIADQYNNRIRKVTRDGIITTVVGNGVHGYGGDGGPPLSAALDFPSGVTFDSQGNLYIIDHHNNRVRKVVFNPPALALSSSSLTFATTVGAPDPPPQTFVLSNQGTGALPFTITIDQPWFFVTPTSGTLSAGTPVTVTAALAIARRLAAGEYAATITIQAEGAVNNPQRVAVTLVVREAAAPPPAFAAAGVVHSASFVSGSIAPGQIISIFGTNLGPATGLGAALDPATGRLATSRGGVAVLFNDVPGPLFFVRQDQINVQVPYEVSGQTSARVVVRYLDAPSSPVAMPVTAAAPGIFAVSQGKGQAALLNQDFSVNSAVNPAPRGSAIQIYLTGQGITSPAAVTGQLTEAPFPVPALPVTVTIGGRRARTLFTGLAPGFAGLLQINAVVPEDVVPADNVDLTVAIGPASTQAGVTLAVR